jgi:hypothetical protein
MTFGMNFYIRDHQQQDSQTTNMPTLKLKCNHLILWN